MIKAGITGGIGSGKTTVCHIIETLNIPVYYADIRAKLLMQENEPLVEKIKQLFGNDIYTSAGDLNRKKLAGIVFSDKKRLVELNGLVHPAVFLDVHSWYRARERFPYTVKEAALMIESGSHKLLDFLIVVYCPVETRIKRVMQRDQSSREEVLERIRNQMPEEEKLIKADYIIYNDGSKMLIPQIMKLHDHLLKIA